jgi:hypothetical protein
MSDETLTWRMTEYEGFEIHVAARALEHEAASAGGRSSPVSASYTYIGYVCHPGADPKLPGHAVPFHADGEEVFETEATACDEAVHIGRSIVDGTHPDLTVLPLVTGGV